MPGWRRAGQVGDAEGPAYPLGGELINPFDVINPIPENSPLQTII
jgi:hypothetical protein